MTTYQVLVDTRRTADGDSPRGLTETVLYTMSAETGREARKMAIAAAVGAGLTPTGNARTVRMVAS